MSREQSSAFDDLAEIADSVRILSEEKKRQMWQGSKFEWMLPLPSRTKGAVFEQIMEKYLISVGLPVGKAGTPDYDRVVNGKTVEIKGSTLWESGIYKFQQIRNKPYEKIICLGISPFEASCWVIPKSFLLDRGGDLRTDLEGFGSQHTGRGGRETFWLQVNPDSPQDWLARFGGNLSTAVPIIKRSFANE